MDKANKLILVTGAAGSQGEATALELLKAGFKVRALVFKSDAKKLEQAGAEIVRGSFDDLESLVKAMEGVYGVFAMQNPDISGSGKEGLHAKNLADSALKAGVKQIVQTSVGQVGNHEKFPGWEAGRLDKDYWLGKHEAVQAIVNSGVQYWTVLKPPGLMENFIQPKAAYMSPHLRQGELLTNLNPDHRLQLLAAEDVGKFAVAAFSDPQAFHQKSIDLAGEALTMTEIAEKLSHILGKKVKAVHITREEASARGVYGMAVVFYEWLNEVGYCADIEGLKQYNIPLTSFEEFIKKHKDEFLIEN